MPSATAPGSGAQPVRHRPWWPRWFRRRNLMPAEQALPNRYPTPAPDTTPSPSKSVTSLPTSAATPSRRSTPTPCSATTSVTTRCCKYASSTGSAPNIRSWKSHPRRNCCSPSRTSTTCCDTSPTESASRKSAAEAGWCGEPFWSWRRGLLLRCLGGHLVGDLGGLIADLIAAGTDVDDQIRHRAERMLAGVAVAALLGVRLRNPWDIPDDIPEGLPENLATCS